MEWEPRVGMKVVCIDGKWLNNVFDDELPASGYIYTIREIHHDDDGFMGLTFLEIVNEENLYAQGYFERTFDHTNFKPIYKSMETLYAIAKNPPKKRIRGRNRLDYRTNPLPFWDTIDDIEIDPPQYFIDGRWRSGPIYDL